MKNPNYKIQGAIYTALFLILGWFLFHGQFSLWEKQIPGSGEDGAKNYYTTAYHLKYSSSITHFDGMNYPFGEQVIFTDNQPLVTNLLRLVDASTDWVFYLAVMSGLFGGWCFFLMATRFGIDYRFAMLASLGAMFLSPQLMRLGGHYSLAYIGIIPIFIWSVYNFEKTALKDLLALVIVTSSAFVHPYFMMMLVLFWGSYLLVPQISSGRLKSLKYWAKTILLPLVPILVFQLVLILTDSVMDRPSSPYGFLNYRATWSSIFLPLDFDYFESISSGFQQSSEGGTFIGWFAIIGLLAGAWNLIRSKKLDPSHYLLLASIPILLLSVAFPFYIWKLDRFIDYLGPLKQFRGIARFAFVFYYAVNLFAIIQLGKLVSSWKPMAKITFLSVVLLVFSVDIWSHRNQVIVQTSSGTQVFHSNTFNSVLKNISLSDFQAIVPLPYFHVGSENFRTEEIEGIREMSFALGLESGLPLTGVQMSRTSISQTMMQLELMSYLGRTPQILNEYPSDKALLLLVKDHEPLSQSNLLLVEHSQRIASINGYTIRSLEFSSIHKIVDYNKRNVLSRIDSANNRTIVYQGSHGSDSSDIRFCEENSRHAQRIDWTDLIDPTLNLESGEEYELSFWFYAGDQHSVNTQVWLWERSKSGENLRFEVSEVGDHLEQVIGDWILCTLQISVLDNSNKIQVMLHRDGVNMDIWFDEVMLRNIKNDCFKEGPLNLNNRYIELPR